MAWTAHPALAPVCNEVFSNMGTANQFYFIPDVNVSSNDLLYTNISNAIVTSDGIRVNLDIGLKYMEAWLRMSGCVPINNLMENAATAGVSRYQLYQWVRHSVILADTNEPITPEITSKILQEEVDLLSSKSPIGPDNKFALAAQYFLPDNTGEMINDFLTTLL